MHITLVWSVYEQVLIAALDFGKTDLASVSQFCKIKINILIDTCQFYA